MSHLGGSGRIAFIVLLSSSITPLAEAMRDPHFQGRGLFDHGVGEEDGYLPAAVVPIDAQFRAALGLAPAPGMPDRPASPGDDGPGSA